MTRIIRAILRNRTLKVTAGFSGIIAGLLILLPLASLIMSPITGQSASPDNGRVSGSCHPGSVTMPGVTEDVPYTVTLSNPGNQPVQVGTVGVIFSAGNREIGSDDPAQENFSDDAYPISSFNPVLIGVGQTVSLSMETGTISGAAGNWQCIVASWTS